jgi:hypothetical protein
MSAVTRLRSAYTAADVDLITGDQIQGHDGAWRTIISVTDTNNPDRPGRVWVLDSTGLATCEWAADLVADAREDDTPVDTRLAV